MNLLHKIILTFGILVAVIGVQAQNTVNNNLSWTVKFDSRKVFIENKGQFPLLNKWIIKSSDVLYAFDDGQTKIYFTSTGVIYTFNKISHKEIDKDEDADADKPKSHVEQEREEHAITITSDIKFMNWVNANPNVEITASDPASDYFSYSIYDDAGKLKHINYIKGYNKITYKNLYPNIDVEYTFHPDDGIEYSLILHPGADISNIKMNYSGDNALSGNGDLHVPTLFGDIIEHTPLSYYSENKTSKINSYFNTQTSNSISFKLDNYDNSKTVIIDPWVQTPALPTSHAVMECERDGAGNVYIIGGESPMQLVKYNAAGTIQWTNNTPYDTANYWLGTLATDLAGNSYVTAGSIAQMEKVDANNNVVWTWTSGLMSVDEYWNIAFNCDQTKLIVGGTSGSMLSLHGQIFNINTTNGNVINSQTVAYGNMFSIPTNIQEVRSISSCRNARYYYLTLDTIGCIDQNLSTCPSSTPSIFKTNSTYAFGYKMENYRPNNGNGGIMAIRANRYFVYTQNGTTIHKRALNTGAILATAAIPGGLSTSVLGRNVVGNSGIDIDSCGNVYVGSGNALVEYDANLNLITSVATPYKIYDVAVSTGGNVIAVGATGDNSVAVRTGYVQSFSMSACHPMTLFCCDANICPAGPFCNNIAPVTLTAATAGGTWSGTGITNASTGVFSPSVAGPGVFTIYYTLACGTDSTTITVTNCSPCPGITVTPANIVNVLCFGGSTGSFSASSAGGASPYSYTLLNSGGTTVATYPGVAGSQSFTGLPAGTYTLNVLDANACPGTVTVTITQPASALTATISTSTSPTCNLSDGSITVTAGGGTPGYTYSWNTTPVQTTATAANIPAGSYAVTVTDANGCTATTSMMLNNSSGPSLSTSSTSATCGQSVGTATVTATGGTGVYTYTWNTTPTQTTATISNLPGGNYIVSVSDGVCTITASVTVASTPAATANIINIINETCGNSNGSATANVITGTSPYTYNWNTTPAQTTATASNIPAGTYTVTITDASGCTATASVTITNSPAPVATMGVVNANCGLSNGSATVNVVGGLAPYTYNWNTTPAQTTQTATNLPGGTYNVTVTDANSCTSTATVTLTTTTPPTASISGTVNSDCGMSDGSATLSVTGGTSPYTFSWNSTPPQSGQNLVNVPAGNYIVTITDASGCVVTVNVTVHQNPGPVVTVTSTNETCSYSNGTATATATGGLGVYTYIWSNGATGSAINNLSAGNYTVTVSDGGCTSAAMITIYDTPGPVAGFNAHPYILTIMDGPVSFVDNSTGTIVNWQWNFGDGSLGTGSDPQHQYLNVGNYVVTLIVTDNNGCMDTVTDTIKVKDIFAFYVPSAFTPNGDGLNEGFTPKGINVDPNSYDESIFDRWGNLTFHTSKWYGTFAEPWNGTMNNKGTTDDVIMGVYVYRIRLRELNGLNHEYIGRITLVP